jgi:ribokinase
MRPIVVVGSINMDLVSHTDRIPRPGETILGSGFEMHSGGKGANQAVAVARLGYPSILLGAVGDDIFGSNLRSILCDFRVDLSQVETVQGTSGTAMIAVDSNGENSIIVVPGANTQVTPRYLLTKRDILASAGMVLTQLEIPMETIQWLADFCEAHSVPLMLDPAPAAPLPASVWSKVSWFTPNQTESLFYVGEEATSKGMVSRLLGKGIANVILKQGSNGAIIANAAGSFDHVDAFPVSPVDTTAAGDAFNGAFAVSLMRGSAPLDSARFAAAAAALSVTRRGAQPSLANEQDVLAFLGSGTQVDAAIG